MPYEDFQNDYNDNSGAELNAVTTRLTFTQYERQDAGYFDKDFGIAYFDDFTVWFDFEISDVEAGDADSQGAGVRLLVFGNAVGENPLDRLRVRLFQDGANDDRFFVRFDQATGGVLDYRVDSASMANDTLYCSLTRAGVNLTLDCYSTEGLRVAAGNGDLVDLDDGGNGSTTDYRYLHGCTGVNSGVDPNDHITGWLDKVCLTGGACAVTGHGWITKGGWW